MKKFMFLVILLVVLLGSIDLLYSYTQIVVKVKDICEYSPNSTCVIGYSNKNGVPMTLRLKDYKNKEGGAAYLDPELPDVPFPCPSGYTEYNDYFIPDGNNNGHGLGVIGGVLYINETNPTEEFYYWVFDTSQMYDDYEEWQEALDN